jgi:capsular polysaccharide biosynthesis protein
VLGLLLAGAFLVVMTAVDRTFRSPADVPTLLDLPILAVVPLSRMLNEKASRKQPEPATKLNASSRARAS